MAGSLATRVLVGVVALCILALGALAAIPLIVGAGWFPQQLSGSGASRAVLQPPASEARRVARIGYLGTLGADWPAPFEAPRRELFVQGLRDLGYVEGQTVDIEYRFADGDRDLLPQLAQELVDSQVDVIVLADSSAVGRAAAVTKTVPLVMTVVTDPVGLGLVQSLTRPGGNLTGQSTIIADLHEKRLGLIRTTLAGRQDLSSACNALLGERGIEATDGLCVAIFWDQNLSSDAEWKAAEAAGQKLGVGLISEQVRSPDDFEDAVRSARDQGASAVFVFESPFLIGYNQRIADLAIQYGLPLFAISRQFVQAGALEAYTPSYPALYKRAAEQAVQIIRGADPAEMPVEQPTRFDLIVNNATAHALDLTIPRQIMDQSTEVIR